MAAPYLRTRLRQEESKLEAVGKPELSKNGRQVRLDRSFADEQPPGDIPIGRASADEPGDLAFTRCQQGKAPVGPEGGFRELLRRHHGLLDEQRDQSPLGPDLALSNAVYGFSQQRRSDSSLAVSSSAGLEACDALHVIRRRREHDDPGLPADAADDRKVGDPARMQKLRVQQHDPRIESRNRPVQGFPSRDLVHGIGALKTRPHPAPEFRLRTRNDDWRIATSLLLFIG
jgi:hypothetical protein